MTITENIRKELQTLVDSKYQEFHSALVPGTENILGVRIPQLRVMAKEIAKRDDWRIFIEATDTKFYEEAMLQGMVIGRSKTALDEQMKYVKRFVPRIDNTAAGSLQRMQYPGLPHCSLCGSPEGLPHNWTDKRRSS